MDIMQIVAIFVITSAFLNAVMELAKVYFGEKEHFNKLKPLIPPFTGAVIGTVVAIATYGALVYNVGGFALGFLAGTMSTTSYEIFESFIKKRVQ